MKSREEPSLQTGALPDRISSLSRADLETLIDTSPVGVVVLDARTGHSVSCNREARRIVAGLLGPGQTVEQLLPAMTCRFADGREVALVEFPLAVVLNGAAAVSAEEIVLAVRGGRSARTLINATPIETADGTVESVVVTMQDLGPLDELERRRAELLDMVSHELRAPLSSIKGLTATVLGNSGIVDPAEARQFFRIIAQQADDMDGLIRDLLDAGRIETGTLSVDPQLVDVATLVDHARRTFLSSGARHNLTIDLAPDLARVMADEQRIAQVLNNLFSYAAGNSPKSSPIRVTALQEGTELAISVTGESAGAAPDRLPHLFRKHAAAGGAGGARGRDPHLGLAICRALVEAHGGRIRAESLGPGRETRITFTLPAVEDTGGRTSPPCAASSRGEERAAILVVDDDPLALRIVRQALVSAGFAASVTGDPHELSHLISTRRPQLVLLDLVFPGVDGIALMESVPALADLPVIFLSGYGGDETIARALEAGAADYIVKPFSATELTARVRAALRKRNRPAPFLVADLAIDYEMRRVTVGGRAVRLTATEYDLLRVLSVNAGRVLTYDSLLRQIWGERVTAGSEPVRTFIKKLRGKLSDDPACPTYIFNERGVGYRMAVPGDR